MQQEVVLQGGNAGAPTDEDGVARTAKVQEQQRIRDSALQSAATNRAWKPGINYARFAFVSLNFILSVVFSTILVAKAFVVDDIDGLQVFHTDRVLQSSELQPPAVMNSFVKQACGADSEILGIATRLTRMQQYLPHMFEVAGSNSMLRLEAVHCNYMLFSALWISSAFSLAMAQLPGNYALEWSQARVVVVHAWNMLGIIFTVVIFSGTTKWKKIPLSNLFYSLVGQAMAWVYQYFHMVECTQSLAHNDLSMRYITSGVGMDTLGRPRSFSYYSTELRKLIYMEFSVVAPMFLVAGIMPGMIGIDEWRIQTVLFSSWTLFALLGLHLRFRKALKRNMTKLIIEECHGYDALGYLTFAIVLVFMMLLNAMGRTSFYDAPYATSSIISARWASRVLVIVAAVMVLEAVVLAVVVRVWPGLAKRERVEELEQLNTLNREKQNLEPTEQPLTDEEKGELLEDIDPHLIPSFLFNIVILGFGSVMVKILVFSGLSNVHALSNW